MSRHLLGIFQSLWPSDTPQVPGWQPNTDIYRTANGWLIKFDLAGVRPEDVELSVQGNRLSLRGVRRDWCLEECCHCYQLEIAYSQFERHLTLPANLDGARVEAEHRDGLLLVRIRSEEDTP
jgi:HSP20 family protein